MKRYLKIIIAFCVLLILAQIESLPVMSESMSCLINRSKDLECIELDGFKVAHCSNGSVDFCDVLIRLSDKNSYCTVCIKLYDNAGTLLAENIGTDIAACETFYCSFNTNAVDGEKYENWSVVKAYLGEELPAKVVITAEASTGESYIFDSSKDIWINKAWKEKELYEMVGPNHFFGLNAFAHKQRRSLRPAWDAWASK